MSIPLERPYRWRIKGEPEVGDEIEVIGRRYRIIDVDPHFQAQSGKTACLIKWLSVCKACSAEFEFSSTKSAFEPVATCPDHRRTRPLRQQKPSLRAKRSRASPPATAS